MGNDAGNNSATIIKQEKFKSLQVLRGIGAIAVLLYHINVYMINITGNNNTFYKVFNEYFSYGAIMFFAISGFLMPNSLKTNFTSFLAKRILRIYPTYIIIAILCIFTKVIIFSSITQTDLLKSISLLPFGVIPYPLGVEWTLIYEIFFYCICSLFTFKYMKTLFPYFLIIWLIIISIGTFKLNIATGFLPTYKTIFFSAFNVSFIMGGLAYYIYRKFSIKFKIVNYLLILISVFMICVFGYYSRTIIFFGQTAYFAYGTAFAIIIYAMINLERNSTKKYSKYLIILGNNSYSLYLVHVPIITIFFAVNAQYLSGKFGNLLSTVAIILSLVFGIIFGKMDLKINEYFNKNLRSHCKMKLN